MPIFQFFKIADYKKCQLLERISPKFSIYKVQKNGQFYLMHEFSQINECDEYSFKIIKKLVTYPQVVKIIQKFTENQKTYFITQYFPSTLHKQQLKMPNQVFQIQTALQYFSQILQLIEIIHNNKIILRNFTLQSLAFQNNLVYLQNFQYAQIVKRKQRYFQVMGNPNYLAPEFFMEDGYGFEVDIWAAGVCLYVMLTGTFPFQCLNKTKDEICEEISTKCKSDFNFKKLTANHPKLKLKKIQEELQDLFDKIFKLNYNERITLEQIKTHNCLKKYLKSSNHKDDNFQLSTIEEQKVTIYSSIFVSMLKSFPCHFQFHKEEIIFDFFEISSEIFMLQSHQLISEQIRTLVNFSILKVAILKINNFIDVLAGKRKPEFKIDSQQWQAIKTTTGFVKVKQKIEKKKKILEMLFKTACLNVQKFRQQSKFYSDEIPQEFSSIKHEYRQNLSVMFQLQKEILKKKQSRKTERRSLQNLARLGILCLVNRVFQQPDVREDFKLYFNWSKKQSLQDLEEWIQTQRLTNLTIFIKNLTKKYME